MDELDSRGEEDPSGVTSASHDSAKTDGGLICISFTVFKLHVLCVFCFPPEPGELFCLVAYLSAKVTHASRR